MIRSPQRQLAPDTGGPGIDETTSLRGIADKAEHDKAHRFGNLYGELNEALLKEAWRGLNQSAASGIDRVMARDYEQELDANLEDLVERLKGKRYRATAVRRHKDFSPISITRDSSACCVSVSPTSPSLG